MDKKGEESKISSLEEFPQILLKIRTSNQWSLLDSVSRKLSMEVEDLEKLILSVDSKLLKNHGIWVQKVGKCYILCSNPSFRNRKGKKCNCKGGGKENQSKKSIKRYFGSMDYNAGRHGSSDVKHISNCPQWQPPSAGHLHSWRRGYKKKSTKKK